jgi:chloramphenicol O-acetyltransferase type A
MRVIDLETWPRRKHFAVYAAMDYPHFGLCANVDISRFQPWAKQHGLPFTIALVYVLAHAANRLPAFRYRIRAGQVVEHEVVHPSSTVLGDDDLFSFCTIPYAAGWDEFAGNAARCIAQARANPTLEDEPGQDDLLFMSGIPWVSFTSMFHPIHIRPADSVPRIAWGKFFADGQRLKLPLAVQVHHALMDGVHVGRYYQLVQELLDQPPALFGQA